MLQKFYKIVSKVSLVNRCICLMECSYDGTVEFAALVEVALEAEETP